MERKPKSLIVVVLHNIRSAGNVGSMFRTAEAAGVSKLYLTGYTPAPFDRFGRPVKEITKTALGAERLVPWEKKQNIFRVFAELTEKGFQLAAVEQSSHSIDYQKFAPPQKLALVFGNEVRGLSKKILARCDAAVEIAMRGAKESLNVAVAFGVILFTFQKNTLA